jgi:hypothetical protein
MKKKIIESEYTTIRIHKKTAKYLEKMRMKNYDEAVNELVTLNKERLEGK